MKKLYFSLLFLCVLSLFLSGCGAGRPEIGKAFLAPCRYEIGYAVNGAKGTAVLEFSADGAMSLLFTDTNSPLFGMQKIYTADGVKTLYHEIETADGGIYDPLSELKTIFETLAAQTYHKTAQITISGVPSYQHRFPAEQGEITLFTAADSLKPVKIEAKLGEYRYEINFKIT